MLQTNFIKRAHRITTKSKLSEESQVAEIIEELPKHKNVFLVRYDSVMQVGKTKYYTCRYTTISLVGKGLSWEFISVEEYNKLNKKYTR